MHFALQEVVVEKYTPFMLRSSRFVYLKLYHNDHGRRVEVVLPANAESRLRELLSSLGVSVKDKASKDQASIT